MRTLVFTALALWGASSIAQGNHDWYVGVGIGQLDYKDSIPTGWTVTDTTESYKLYAGFRYEDGAYRQSFEVGYRVTGDLEWDEADIGAQLFPGLSSVLDVSVTIPVEYEILSAMAIAHFGWFMIGVGVYGVETNRSINAQIPISVPPISVPIPNNDNGPMAIIGAEFDIAERVSMRVEYEWLGSGTFVDLSTMGLGVAFRF